MPSAGLNSGKSGTRVGPGGGGRLLTGLIACRSNMCGAFYSSVGNNRIGDPSRDSREARLFSIADIGCFYKCAHQPLNLQPCKAQHVFWINRSIDIPKPLQVPTIHVYPEGAHLGQTHKYVDNSRRVLGDRSIFEKDAKHTRSVCSLRRAN